MKSAQSPVRANDNRIGGYLSIEEHAAFKEYAASLQLGVSALASLLIEREIRVVRLAKLAETYRRHLPLSRRRRITAKPQLDGCKAVFDVHVRKLDLSPDAGAGILFRAELTERWLERSVLMEST